MGKLSTPFLGLSSPTLTQGGINVLDSVESFEVIERTFTMRELLVDLKQGILLANFIVGTAVFVTPVSEIHFRAYDIQLTFEEVPHVTLLRQWLYDVMYRNEPSGWVEVIAENE